MNHSKVKHNLYRIGLLILVIATIIVIIFASSTSPSMQHNIGIASIKKAFTDHQESVWKVHFSKDGKLIASCSIDSTVLVRDKESGKVISRLKHPAGVTNFALSDDGNYIATSSYDEKVRLWRFSDSHLIKEFAGHEGTVWTVDISKDGKTIASGGEDKTIRLWSTETGALLNAIPAHKRNIWSIKFHPTSPIIASSSFDNDIKLWSTATGALIKTLSSHTEAVVDIAFNADGNLLASAADDASLKIWSVNEGKLLKTLSTNEHQHAVAFSPDGKRIVGGGSDKPMFGEFLQHLFGDSHRNKGVSMRIWDVATGGVLQTFTYHSNDVNGVAYSKDGRWIASASADQTVSLWE
ncbi:MAG TPA: WD40 repeat domain-containing protein, partial [Flavisolibacter sp.]|nr:WD40 repeat domain-containing protein [Flavisolibacter sp.]